MVVCALGDLLLDVVVRLDRSLVQGDDVTARTLVTPGGQAANVAAWVVALGGRARYIGKRADDESGRLAAAALAGHGVEIVGPVERTGGGIVVSLVDPGGERTMASDRGAAGDLQPDEIDPAWLDCEHLHVSGYTLARAPGRAAAGRAIQLARDRGARISVDLAASTVIQSIGIADFRALLTAQAPDVVFCTEEEERALGGRVVGPTWVVKRGARGVSVDGVDHAAASAAQIVDATGAGDAFAAGWIVGGVSTALAAAAQCVAQIGAFPRQR